MYLGIDVGTSGVKLCVLHHDGRLGETALASLETAQPFFGASEQHPDAWWEALVQAAADLRTRADLSGIRAIGLSGQMHGAVVLDAAHRPIRPAILWNDGRSQPQCDALRAALPEIGQIAGVFPMPGFTAPKLMWLKAHEPDSYRRIAHVLLPKDYIGLRLHGGVVTDPCDAAGTLWLDEAARAWSPEVCAASDTDLAWLPRLLDGPEVAGRLSAAAATALGLPKGILVAAGAGDAAAGAVGIGAVGDGDAFLSLGTSGQLFAVTDSYRPNPESMVHAYAHTMPGLWFKMSVMLNGARPMAWLAKLLNRPIAELLSAAETAAPGPVFLPYLTGERSPHADPDIRGGFWGLADDATPGTLMRAVVEAVAFSFADAARALAVSGTAPPDYLAVGGGARSDFLLQMMADVLQTRIGRSDGAEVGPALGAARLAQLAAGEGTVAEVVTRPAVSRRFEPAPGGAAPYAERLARYRALYPALKSVGQAVP